MQTKLETGHDARLACRSGQLTGTTADVAHGYVQGNLAILPQDLSADFLRFCQLNPKPCPLIGVSELGNPRITALGHDLDVRTDLPCWGTRCTRGRTKRHHVVVAPGFDRLCDRLLVLVRTSADRGGVTASARHGQSPGPNVPHKY